MAEVLFPYLPNSRLEKIEQRSRGTGAAFAADGCMKEKFFMANIGEPQRIIIAEPVFDPIPEKEPKIDQPVEEPEELPSEP